MKTTEILKLLSESHKIYLKNSVGTRYLELTICFYNLKLKNLNSAWFPLCLHSQSQEIDASSREAKMELGRTKVPHLGQLLVPLLTVQPNEIPRLHDQMETNPRVSP